MTADVILSNGGEQDRHHDVGFGRRRKYGRHSDRSLWKSQTRTAPGTTRASAIAPRTWCAVVGVPLAAKLVDTRGRRTSHGQTAMGSQDGATAHDVRRYARGLAGGRPDARLR